MRLVVTFKSCCYECAGELVLPIEYDSAEAFLVDFEEAVKAHALAKKEYQEAQKAWFRKEPKEGTPAWLKWAAKSPSMKAEQVDLNGYKFYPEDHVNVDCEYDLPKVQTVEEWFSK